MIKYHDALQTFRSYSYEQKRQKVFLMVEAIFTQSGKWERLYILLKDTTNIPERVLEEIYQAMMEYGRNMDEIAIEEKLGKTQAKLEKIWEHEEQERKKEEVYLRSLMDKIQSL